MKRTAILFTVIMLFIASLTGCGSQQEKAKNTIAEKSNKDVILATTTSTQDSGLLDVLIPAFEKETGYNVKTIAVGTGQALAMGERGEADVLLTHAPASEQKLVDKGIVTDYSLVMHNDFILVGPAEDPARVKGKEIKEALKAISQQQALFLSRGDNSGTHKFEQKIWEKVGIKPAGKWYQSTGSGMGQTLSVAAEKRGYTITDRGTYLALKDKLNLEILVQGSNELKNIYHVMAVNPDKYPKVNAKGARAFIAFLLKPDTQKLIGQFGVDKYGQPLFYPDAIKQ
ncbi:tungstate transport system substrate-binding protein [Carboxydocella sporoproducens DSM 16521]|uniref:Tungstate transport system substrate-binding protein n=2 Tax=Carboxydocella TaxID=178898 RepID=A0A1T4NLQ4_9FIRM|nr:MULTISPECIES: substrate-binding domain-containing protein [Carboxydocella]AVX20082.1 tungstate transport system substrate-binding protein [Carboxydocella thermautotrophica]AVX30499.1 tungstate transport system substrate-binding protein [Carboxydocella thermautotrophica]GAW27842.1 tungsten ABC transporter substrate-binding protein [Carboxydocella sp. ULO1]SJZ79688.1 tungstate transport system substrate-binding protein [Carboxydocella sporoproducens DSM 16521]